MKVDYKFWFIRRDDDGFITEAAVRFYEGSYVKQLNPDTGKEDTVYKRSKRLEKKDLKHLNDKYKTEHGGKEAKLYDVDDFGQIKTDDELREFLNPELAKDSKREAIEEQK